MHYATMNLFGDKWLELDGLVKEEEIPNFFHSFVNCRWKKSSLKGLHINREWEEYPPKVKVEVRNFFKNEI